MLPTYKDFLKQREIDKLQTKKEFGRRIQNVNMELNDLFYPHVSTFQLCATEKATMMGVRNV